MPPRVRAALVQLAICTVIAALAFVPIYFLWYPGVLFESAGGRELFFLIVGVSVTIGPLITLIIFKPGKWGLGFDLVVIAILQAGALAFGAWVLFESRPVYIAFVKDRYELLRANAYPQGMLEKGSAGGYDRLPWSGPRLIGVRLPTDPDEAMQLMISGLNGVDAQYFAQYYVPYGEVRAEVAAHALPIAALRERNPLRGRDIDQALARLGRGESDVSFVPMRAGKIDLAVLVDRRLGDVLKITSLDPWSVR
jgi:hypothetical protein